MHPAVDRLKSTRWLTPLTFSTTLCVPRSASLRKFFRSTLGAVYILVAKDPSVGRGSVCTPSFRLILRLTNVDGEVKCGEVDLAAARFRDTPCDDGFKRRCVYMVVVVQTSAGWRSRTNDNQTGVKHSSCQLSQSGTESL
jgi:hypothetical protein